MDHGVKRPVILLGLFNGAFVVVDGLKMDYSYFAKS